MRLVLAFAALALFATAAGAQIFFPPFPPPIASGPPIVQAPRKDIFILNGRSVAILNGISQ